MNSSLPRSLWFAAILVLPLAGRAGQPLAAPRDSHPADEPVILITPGNDAPADRIATLEKETRKSDADASAWVRLGDALMQHSRESLDPALYARAERAYQRALELDPQHLQALLGLAWVHNTEHDFDSGRRFARAALEINPRLPEAHALLGDAAVEFGDYDTAFEHYQEALDLRPDLSSYSRAAHLLWLTGDTVKARWLMRKAIDSGGPHPENTAWCRAQLALMLLQTGALLSAEGEIKLALVESPRNPHVLAAAGRIQTARKDYAAAIEFYHQSIATAPTHDALAALVDLYELAGRHDEAKAQFDRVAAFHTSHGGHSHGHAPHGHEASVKDGHADHASPGHHHHDHPHSHPHGNAQLARFYADHNRNLDEALREARAAWTAFPNIQAADTLAWCLYWKGEFKEASRMIRRALQHGTPDATIHFHAGMIHARLGNRPLAQRHLYRALNLNPQFHPTQPQLAVDTLKTLAGRPSLASVQDAPQSSGSKLSGGDAGASPLNPP
jgi:tetratricopeptide (TPR) repeat protein